MLLTVILGKVLEMKTKPLLVLSLAASMLMMPLASYAESTWDMWNMTTDCVSGSTACSTTNATSGNTLQFAGETTMSATAWSTAPDATAGADFAAATLKNYGVNYGFGVTIANDGQHSMDNKYGTDLIALSFDQAVALTSVKLGWVSNDSDISVLRYTGSTTNSTLSDAISGKSIAQLIGSGWDLVGNYANVGYNGTANIINQTDANITNGTAAISSWWLISAYNSLYGVSDGSHGGTTYASLGSYDYVKLISVAGNIASPPPPGQTPEPAGIALVGLGLLGVMFSRRQRRPS